MWLRPGRAAMTLALLLAGCNSGLGRQTPRCDETSGTLLLSWQAVQVSEYVPCVLGLPAGWSYVDLQAKSGQSIFWLDSDRMGDRFLEVRLEPSCSMGPARGMPSDEEPIPLFMDVVETMTIPITVIPEGTNLSTFAYADEVAADLKDETIKGRKTLVRVDAGSAPTAERIERARTDGDFVFVVSLRNSEDGTVTVIPPGSSEEIRNLSRGRVRHFLEEENGPPTYRGSWYYPFDTACITYLFDAEGPGVDTIETDVQAALGLFSTQEVRSNLQESGYSVP